jgi:hypothetical protein
MKYLLMGNRVQYRMRNGSWLRNVRPFFKKLTVLTQ